MLTYEQAQAQAVQLRAQGQSYPAIEEHLKKIGYISPFTRKPVGHLAVRVMVTKATQEAQRDKVNGAKLDKEEAPIMVSSPKGDMLDVIKALLTATQLDVNMRLKLIKLAVNNTEGM
jgi:uncharacterized membrane protein